MKFDFTHLKLNCVLLLLLISLVGCKQNYRKPTSPVLSPQESLKHFKLADDGLKIKLVASEPLVRAPVAIKFDVKGRMWVVEMPNFMRDTTGVGKDTAMIRD